jgi:hypothetical protein
MGVGKVDRTGLKVKKKERSSTRASSNKEDGEGLSRKAEGLEFYCMVNVSKTAFCDRFRLVQDGTFTDHFFGSCSGILRLERLHGFY